MSGFLFIIFLIKRKMFKPFIRNYFGFNKQQRNGLLILVCISFILLIIRITYPYFLTPDKIIIKNLPLIERRLDSSFQSNSSNYKTTSLKKKNKDSLFIFNPNTISFNELILLGLQEKTANIFINYRLKGFVFKKKSDLTKVYGISPNFYSKIEPYIYIENTKTITPNNSSEKYEAKVVIKENQIAKIIELNLTDSIQLISIKGIGPIYAKKILKYRSILGGFNSVNQLKEVYGFTEELYNQLKSFFTANPLLIKKIKINQDDFKTINKHPYLSFEITKLIFDWRRKTNINSTNLKDILNDDLLYLKILPYLDFN